MSVDEAFKEMFSRLNPTEKQHERIRATRLTIDATLENNSGIHLHPTKQASFFTGSYSRKTIIRPLDDIDLYVRIHYGHHAQGKPPTEILRLMRRALSRRYPNTTIRVDPPCIVIRFVGFKFEIVPAVCYENDDDLYNIPGMRGKEWIQSYPRLPDKWISSSNQANNNMFIPFIKILKQWKRNKAVPFKSFHMELLTEMVFNEVQITNYPFGLYAWMYYASEWIESNHYPFVQEPGKNYTFVDEYLYNERRTLLHVRHRLREGLRKTEQAFNFWKRGRTFRAKGLWHDLFGDKFPGGKPAVPVVTQKPKTPSPVPPSLTEMLARALMEQPSSESYPKDALLRALLEQDKKPFPW